MMREELKEMREWRSQMTDFMKKSAANTQDDEMEEEENILDDSVEIGWVNHLKGAQAKPSTPGATSLASLMAIPPPSGPDSKTGKGGNTISRGPTDPCSKAAQSGSEALPDTEKAGDANALHGT